jgi:hypothetical protein
VYPFEYKYPRGIEFYLDYFEGAPADAKVGELSPFYYFDPLAAHRIARAFPDVRIIALLRNPVDMVYSLYLLLRQRERREQTFEEEILRHPDLLELGFYHRLLVPYFDWFPKEKIFVRTFEDFFCDEERSCRELFKFLGVDSSFRPSLLGSRINASTEAPPSVLAPVRGIVMRMLNSKRFIPVKELLHGVRIDRLQAHVAKATHKDTERETAHLSIAIRKQLLDLLDPDIRRLEKLLDKSLSTWTRTRNMQEIARSTSKPTGSPLDHTIRQIHL